MFNLLTHSTIQRKFFNKCKIGAFGFDAGSPSFRIKIIYKIIKKKIKKKKKFIKKKKKKKKMKFIKKIKNYQELQFP